MTPDQSGALTAMAVRLRHRATKLADLAEGHGQQATKLNQEARHLRIEADRLDDFTGIPT